MDPQVALQTVNKSYAYAQTLKQGTTFVPLADTEKRFKQVKTNYGKMFDDYYVGRQTLQIMQGVAAKYAASGVYFHVSQKGDDVTIKSLTPLNQGERGARKYNIVAVKYQNQKRFRRLLIYPHLHNNIKKKSFQMIFSTFNQIKLWNFFEKVVQECLRSIGK